MGKNSDKKRPSHTLISNIGYIFRLQWKYSKTSLLLLLLGVPISLGISYCGIYMPKAVVEQIMTGGDFYKAFIPILIIGIITLFLNISNQIIATINFALLPKFKNCLLNLKAEKCLNTDYENIESPKFRFLMQRADEALMVSNSGSAVEQMSKGSIALLTSILEYIMFGTVLSFAHPIIILILTIMPVINYFVIRSIQKFQYKSKNETIPLDKKLWYIATNAENYKSAKDIRIYGMNSWLINMFRYFTKERLKWDVRLSKKHFIASVIDGVIILLRDGTAYVILIYMVINEQISIDNFILFFSAVGSFTSAVGSIIGQLASINSTSLIVCDLRDFLGFPEKFNRLSSDSDIFNRARNNPTIDIDKVSFIYPESSKQTIKEFSIKINKGEKIAIVGLNGAGKTTLIKMICGLYTPSEGSIRINNVDIKDYNIEEYYKLFSVVFQDQHFMPVTIAETVASTNLDMLDRDRVDECLIEAGLCEKVRSLKNGMDTLLNKQVNAEGVELSGGEYQKLLLARAIYKDSPIIILDEPTAALDPIAENELYLKYNSLFEEKTVIFISHRLASTRFCDRILLLQDGQLVESGTHEKLLKLNGKYAELFNAQKKYYVESGGGVL